jgi:hypothetical protein
MIGFISPSTIQLIWIVRLAFSVEVFKSHWIAGSAGR